MNPMKRLILLVLIGLLLFPALFVSAQDDFTPPIVVRLFGSDVLYSVRGDTVEALDYCQPQEDVYNGFPIELSPDGTRFAFLATTTLPGEQAGMNNGAFNADNVYICNMQDETLTQITTQPEGATAGTTVEDSVYTVYGTPAWSPDGTQIAWAQVNTPDGTTQLVVYNLEAETSEVLSEGGLVLADVVYTTPERTGEDQRSILVYRANGEDVVETTEFASAQVNGGWVLYEGDYHLFAQDAEGVGALYNPASGEFVRYEGVVEYYSLLAPETSLGLVNLPTESVGLFQWAVRGEGFTTPLGIEGNQYGFTLSPDGQQVIYVTFASYPDGGQAFLLPDPTDLASAQPIAALNELNIGTPIYVHWAPLGQRIVNQ
jgi:hypothetical protein